MHTNNHIDYVELTAPDLDAVTAFYDAAFGWTFQSYGPDYVAFSGQGTDGGFARGEGNGRNPLVILYADALEASHDAVRAAGGTITRDIFSFPGGRRFHFTDPAGNELAVWGS